MHQLPPYPAVAAVPYQELFSVGMHYAEGRVLSQRRGGRR